MQLVPHTLLPREVAPTMDCDLDTTIPDWIIEHPQTHVVFDELGLDTSCGGKSLRYLCHRKGLSPQAVLERLQQVVERD